MSSQIPFTPVTLAAALGDDDDSDGEGPWDFDESDCDDGSSREEGDPF